MQAQEAGYLQAGVTTVNGAAAVAAPNRVYRAVQRRDLLVQESAAVRAAVQPSGGLCILHRLDQCVGIGQGVLTRDTAAAANSGTRQAAVGAAPAAPAGSRYLTRVRGPAGAALRQELRDLTRATGRYPGTSPSRRM